ncbi:MAG: signal recognition particle protein [Nitriliruptoraceae bacterium]
MFDALSARLDATLDRVRSRGRLDAKSLEETLRDIRLALLEADVNVTVVRGFLDRLRTELIDTTTTGPLTGAQTVIKAVDQELTRVLGGTSQALTLPRGRLSVVMLAGLQGAGKTTVAGKLAQHLKQQGRTPMLVACDLQRPAAVEQLKVNAERVGAYVYAPATSGDPIPVAADSVAKAQATGCDVLIVDTAGRLSVDEVMLEQAKGIKDALTSDGIDVTTLFVIDAMIGQEAVNVARAFADTVGFDGVILSKLDGDARGGAALSVREVTGAPIMFASLGESLDAFEVFHPDRMASRILGMGDMLSLIEKAEATYTEDETKRAEEALLSGEFTFDDFLEQMQMLKRMGSLKGIVGMLPGVGKQLKDADLDERQLARVEAIIRSMTPTERRDPKNVLNGRRRKRIAAGSGTTVTDVNRLVNQFVEMQRMLKAAAKSSKGGGGKKHATPRSTKAQAAALRQLQQQAGGGGFGGFTGLQPPKKSR